MSTDTPDLPAVAQNPGFLLSRLGQQVRRGFADSLTALDVRPVQYGLLAGLEVWGHASQQELSAALRVDRGDMVRLLDDLEARGLVERTPDPADRRRHAVRLTAHGRALLRKLHGVSERFTSQFFAALTERERAQLERLLTKLWRATERADPASGRTSRKPV